MQRTLLGGSIKRSTNDFSVNGDAFTSQRSSKLIDPMVHRVEELACIKPTEDSSQRLVTWDAVFKFDVAAKPIDFCMGEPLDIGPTVGSTDRRGQHHKNHFEQVMIATSLQRLGTSVREARYSTASRLTQAKTTQSIDRNEINMRLPCGAAQAQRLRPFRF